MDISLNTIPQSSYNEASFRSHLNSNKINEQNLEISRDILDLYNNYNILENKCNSLIEQYSCENYFLKDIINDLELKVKSLESLVNSTKTVKEQYVFPSDITEGNVYPAQIDNKYNSITITPYTSISKTKIQNSVGEWYIPDSLKVEFDMLNDDSDIILIEENDTSNMFDKCSDTSFIRKITAKNNVNSISMTLTITIPEEIVNNYNINEISICPFPLNTLTVSNIEYRIENDLWTRIPGFNEFENYDKDIDCITNFSNSKFNFKNIKANQIRITFIQDNYLYTNNAEHYHYFYIGIKDIEISENKYDGSSNNFSFDVTLKDKKEMNILLKSIEPIFNNCVSNKYIQYEIYYYDDLNELHRINTSLPSIIQSNKLNIKCKFSDNFNDNPNISKLKICYEYQ